MIRQLASKIGAIRWSGNTRWLICDRLAETLCLNERPPIEEWVAAGLAVRTKQGPGRTIYRVRLGGLDFHLKHFRPVGVWESVRQAFRQLMGKNRARKEFRFAQVLFEKGIPSITPLALGERRRFGLVLESFLFTETIAGSTLFDLVESDGNRGPERPSSKRFPLTRQLARLAADLHAAGIEHRDLHERNLVVGRLGNGSFQFHLVDLHEVRTHVRMDWRTTRRELARMGRYFTLRTSRADRWRFFREYARCLGFDPATTRRRSLEMEKETLRSRADFWSRRDHRPLTKNPQISRQSGIAASGWRQQLCPERLYGEFSQSPEAPFEKPGITYLKDGRATRVIRLSWHDRTLVYKQFYPKSWAYALVSLWRPNQPMRAWRAAFALRLREIPTPLPLALLQVSHFGLVRSSFLLTEAVPGGETLRDYIERVLPSLEGSDGQRATRALVWQSAKLLRQLHDRLVSHRDLKASNILVAPTADPGRPKFWLIDLDGVRTHQTLPFRHRLQNLARFHVSFYDSAWFTRADRLRFLRAYLGQEFYQPGRWKALWRQIHAETLRKIDRNRRHGRATG